MKRILPLIIFLSIILTPSNAKTIKSPVYNEKNADSHSIKQQLLDNNPDLKYTIKPKIIKVTDGDTVKIWLYERNTNVRLTGIDCFETCINSRIEYQRSQNKNLTDEEIIKKGQKAEKILKEIISKHPEIYLEITGIDTKWGRLVGILYYKDKNDNFVNINRLMKETGYCPEFIYRKKRK